MSTLGSVKIGRDGDTVHTWSKLAASEHGDPLELSTACVLHAQAIGESAGASVYLEGSNVTEPQDTDWSPLPEGSLGLAIKTVTTQPRWIRPVVEGGDENTTVSVLIALRRI